MIKFESVEVMGWEHAIRGMRNPKNSWERSDSYEGCVHGLCRECARGTTGAEPCEYFGTGEIIIGPNDHKLMMQLAAGGAVHAKYRRMIVVYLDITAPLYWWKEFDTYKVGTVANSCSTMHKIHDKEFTLEDFSCEYLFDNVDPQNPDHIYYWKSLMNDTIWFLNGARKAFLETNDKKYWWQMIQLLPSSYNQKRTIMLNYEVLVGMYRDRKNHKLDEWREFCKWIESLPYSELITGKTEKAESCEGGNE